MRLRYWHSKKLRLPSITDNRNNYHDMMMMMMTIKNIRLTSCQLSFDAWTQKTRLTCQSIADNEISWNAILRNTFQKLFAIPSQGGWVQIWNNKHSEVLTCLSGQAPLTHRRRSINIRPVQVGLVLSEPKYPQKLSYLWNVTRKQALTNTENTKIFRILTALLLLLYCINRR